MSLELLDILNVWPPFGYGPTQQDGRITATLTLTPEITATVEVESELTATLGIDPEITATLTVNRDENMGLANLYVNADNVIQLTGLSADGGTTYVNNATVTFSVTTSAGTAVTGASGTLTYQSASNGNYEGSFPSTVSLTEGGRYNLNITVDADEADGFIRKPCVGAYYEGE